MYPRISGGTRVDMFNNEFRARLSLITSPLPISICFSKARIESMLVSRPMLMSARVRNAKCIGICLLTWIPRPALDFLGLTVDSCGCSEEATSRGRGRWWVRTTGAAEVWDTWRLRKMPAPRVISKKSTCLLKGLVSFMSLDHPNGYDDQWQSFSESLIDRKACRGIGQYYIQKLYTTST